MLLALSVNANASIVDNGAYTTVNGLNWLDFTSTVSMNQTTALSTFSGYRVATQIEMDDLMDTMFDTSFQWDTADNYTLSGIDGANSNRLRFGDLFGFTSGNNSYATVEGLGIVGFDGHVYSGFLNSSYGGIGYSSAWSGIALVNDVSTVPVPAAAWLFGSALLGFFGFARRKANA